MTQVKESTKCSLTDFLHFYILGLILHFIYLKRNNALQKVTK